MILLKEINGVNLHPRSPIMLLVRLFDPSKGVILVLGDYTPKGVIGLPFKNSFQCMFKMTPYNGSITLVKESSYAPKGSNPKWSL